MKFFSDCPDWESLLSFEFICCHASAFVSFFVSYFIRKHFRHFLNRFYRILALAKTFYVSVCSILFSLADLRLSPGKICDCGNAFLVDAILLAIGKINNNEEENVLHLFEFHLSLNIRDRSIRLFFELMVSHYFKYWV